MCNSHVYILQRMMCIARRDDRRSSTRPEARIRSLLLRCIARPEARIRSALRSVGENALQRMVCMQLATTDIRRHASVSKHWLGQPRIAGALPVKEPDVHCARSSARAVRRGYGACYCDV